MSDLKFIDFCTVYAYLNLMLASWENQKHVSVWNPIITLKESVAHKQWWAEGHSFVKHISF